MANTTEGTVQIAGAGTSPDDNKKLYDDWAQKYEQDVRTWGYRMPEECAETLRKYAPPGQEATYRVLDAGAGDGLSGKAITDQGFKEVVGIDLSPELIKIAEKNGIYKKAEVADLSKPLQYKNDEFDAMTIVGVMTYLEPDGCCLSEMCRVVKPGGLVIMTHRTDKVDKWTPVQEKMVKDGKWEVVNISEPRPYLPNNPEYADKIKVIIHTFRVGNCFVRPQCAGNRPLKEADPLMAQYVVDEKERQIRCIELIASENFTSRAVMECLGSSLTNKYSEGQPNARYYGGNEVIDKVENLCKERALKAFGLDDKQWGVNVQPYSGSPANFAVYTAMLPPHSRVMGLDLPSGGHLTHGYYTAKKKISATSIYFESLPYKVHPETGLIDFDALRQSALVYRPQMILCGASAYPRVVDFAKFREIADEVGALLMADIAHISGLVATGCHPAPFEHCDIVTTTTHKSLRGPRSGMIFFKYQDKFPDIKDRIDMAVFPGLQGGPHNHQIGALACQLLEVSTPEFKEYSQQVCANAKALGEALVSKGHKLASGGTDNHLVLWDLRPHGLTGGKVEKVCDFCNITLNKNCVAGDVSALSPGGVRIGTPAMTTRGCKQDDMRKIAGFLDRTVQIALKVQEKVGKKLKDFEAELPSNVDVQALKQEVNEWACKFAYPGFYE